MSLADVSPDEPHGETDSCGFNVYSVVWINKYIAALASLLLSTVKLSDSFEIACRC